MCSKAPYPQKKTMAVIGHGARSLPCTFPRVEAHEQGHVITEPFTGEGPVLPAQSLSVHFEGFGEAWRGSDDAHEVANTARSIATTLTRLLVKRRETFTTTSNVQLTVVYNLFVMAVLVADLSLCQFFQLFKTIMWSLFSQSARSITSKRFQSLLSS